MPFKAVKELWITLGHDDRDNVNKKTKGNDVKRVQSDAEGGGDGAVEYGDSSGNAANKNLFRQSPVDGDFVSVHASPLLKGTAAGKAKKRQTETRCGERDGQTEDNGKGLSHESTTFTEG